MALAHDVAVCLRKLDYSETSQILQLFSRRHGILRVIAKGAHRRTKAGASKFDGGLDLLDVGQAVFAHQPERDLSTLTEWHQIDGHLAIRRLLRPMYLGLYLAELVGLLVEEHDAHPQLFDRLAQTLSELETERFEESALAFQLDLLREAGYLPELSICATCGNTPSDRAAVYFSPMRSGVVCRDCESVSPDRAEVDPRLLRMMTSILRLPRVEGIPQRLPRLTRAQTDPINRVLADHIQHTLGKRLRLAPYVLTNTAARPRLIPTSA